MKETHLFYAPDVATTLELPAEESAHAVRVLRMHEGDALTITDGYGHFYEAVVTTASQKHCAVAIERSITPRRYWKGEIHLAVAPTKNMDRMEWLAEKATEIGFDRLSLLDCDNSERRVVKTERLEKIVVSAMKQSHKPWKPTVEPMVRFKHFIAQPYSGQKFIAHCHEAAAADPATDNNELAEGMALSSGNFLSDLMNGESALVLIGPEGDFSKAEVEAAVAAGFKPVSLGQSRLRTETAALVAVHLMNLKLTQS